MERRKLAIQVSTANPEHAPNPNNKDRSTSRAASTWRHPVKKTPVKQTNKTPPSPRENPKWQYECPKQK